MVAEPAERAHRPREDRPGEHERESRARASSRRAGTPPAARCRTCPRARGSRRAPGPMHGAAQIANAPPSSTREPRLRAPCTRPAPTSRSGQGSSPMKANPKTTRMNPATRSSRNSSRKNPAPMSWAPMPRATNTAVKPSTNGMLASDDSPRGAAVSEPIGLDGRDGREVARHERQDARREERDETRHAARREARSAARASVLVPGELLVHPALEIRVEGGLGLPRRRRRAGGSTSTRARATTTAPTASAPSGSSQASRSKPRFGGSASTAGPNWSTSSALISAPRCRLPRCSRPDVRLHPRRDRRARLVERRLARRADDLGLEIGLPRRPGERGRREDERQRRERAPPRAGSLCLCRARPGCPSA